MVSERAQDAVLERMDLDRGRVGGGQHHGASVHALRHGRNGARPFDQPLDFPPLAGTRARYSERSSTTRNKMEEPSAVNRGAETPRSSVPASILRSPPATGTIARRVML